MEGVKRVNFTGLIDLHTHTFFSDGVLGPAELARRTQVSGYQVIAFTDHVDASNIQSVVPAIAAFCRETQKYIDILLIPGVELTHIPPTQVAPLVREARNAGAELVVLHGESIAEPVAPGTNRAGIEAGVDILAHPGLITEEEVRLAGEKGIALEITSRPSHGITNGRVAALARRFDATLVIDSDFHTPGDQLTEDRQEKVALGAGLNREELATVRRNMISLVQGLKTLSTST